MSVLAEPETRERIARLVRGEMDLEEYRACLNEGHVARRDTILLGVILLEPWPLPSRRRRLLSSVEMEVLRGVADGKTNAEIAAERVVTEEAVKSNVKSILKKLDARNRADAVAIGFRSGLLVVSGSRSSSRLA